MRRRALLRSVPVAALGALAGCADLDRAAVRMDSGVATLHPATDLYIANGLQPDGQDRAFATTAGQDAPDRLGPDAQDPITDALRDPSGDRFYLITQLRSTPEAPISLFPAPGSAFQWRDDSTLRVTVVVEPWGSLDRLDDEDERDRLASADELVYTGVWTLLPDVETIPEDVTLVLESR